MKPSAEVKPDLGLGGPRESTAMRTPWNGQYNNKRDT